MGKIRVKTLGDESLEQKQKEKSKNKSKEKKLVKGTKGGERIVSVGPSEEELARLSVPSSQLSDSGQSVVGQSVTDKPKTDKLKSENRPASPKLQRGEKQRTDKRKSPHSKSYQAIAKIVDRNKKYSLTDALGLLEKLKRSHFDETVELHINTIEAGVSGNITLPHGTGKQIRVAIADPSADSARASTELSRMSSLQAGSGQVTFDTLLKNIERGAIDFDILLATPSAMPKLARVAKILGPKGLMPNPKNGTLTKSPERLALSFAKGQVYFKTEAKAPIMHLTVGKMSFGPKKLSENIQALIDAMKKEKIRNVTLKSTMSPGIKLEL